MKILVAEDDTFLANAYRIKLDKVGHEVKTAVNGDEALRMLPEFKPDVLILDLVMPRKDGFWVLTQMKDDPVLKTIPVLVASNLGQTEDIDRAMELGADDYVVKSDLTLDDLVTKVEHLAKKT